MIRILDIGYVFDERETKTSQHIIENLKRSLF